MQIFSHAKTNNTYRWNNADRTKIRSIERCQQVLNYCISLNCTLGRRSNRSPSIFRFVSFVHVDLHAPALSLSILVGLRKKINMANWSYEFFAANNCSTLDNTSFYIYWTFAKMQMSQSCKIYMVGEIHAWIALMMN